MGFDAIEMAAERAQQLGEILVLLACAENRLCRLRWPESIQPGNIVGVVVQHAVFAKQFGVTLEGFAAISQSFSE